MNALNSFDLWSRLANGDEVPLSPGVNPAHVCVCGAARKGIWRSDTVVVWHGTVSAEKVDEAVKAFGWEFQMFSDFTVVCPKAATGECECAPFQNRLRELGFDRITMGERKMIAFRSRGREDEDLGLFRVAKNVVAGLKNGVQPAVDRVGPLAEIACEA